MAPIDNGFDENMPDEMNITFRYDIDNRIRDAEMQFGTTKGSPNYTIPLLSAAAIINPIFLLFLSPKDTLTTASDLKLSLSPPVEGEDGKGEKINTFAKQGLSFTYMDCGRWSGPTPLAKRQRSFGIAWGQWAVLCEFRPVDPGGIWELPDDKNPINDLLKAIRAQGESIRIIHHVCGASPLTWEQDWNTIYVCLGDTHLPVISEWPASEMGIKKGPVRKAKIYQPDGPAMGRHEYRCPGSDSEGAVDTFGQKKHLCDEAEGWYEKYLAADVFGKPTESAAIDLIRFFDVLRNTGFQTGSGQIRLVQMGDMYDLWMGMELFFKLDAVKHSHAVEVIDKGDVHGKDFVEYWVGRTNKTCANVVSAINSLPPNNTSWLWGNHDNYLASLHTGIPERKNEIRKPGIFIEHGHRSDDSNRDGAISGHQITTTGLWWKPISVFKLSFIRGLDPNRRKDFVLAAALSFAKKPDFFTYVMGHTHSPFLTKVNVLAHLVVTR